MGRKVIQIADSTQLISLPRKWALQHGIKKGDELEVEEKGRKIVISTEKGEKLDVLRFRHGGNPEKILKEVLSK